MPEQVVNLDGASASITAGSHLVTCTGVDLTTFQLRPGDPIRIVNQGKDHFPILHVLSTSQLVLAENATATATGCSFAIGRGDGYHEEEGDGDNNASFFEYGLFRSNAGKGLHFQGSYGPRMIGGFVE